MKGWMWLRLGMPESLLLTPSEFHVAKQSQEASVPWTNNQANKVVVGILFLRDAKASVFFLWSVVSGGLVVRVLLYELSNDVLHGYTHGKFVCMNFHEQVRAAQI
jgi:hypothetical protein